MEPLATTRPLALPPAYRGLLGTWLVLFWNLDPLAQFPDLRDVLPDPFPLPPASPAGALMPPLAHPGLYPDPLPPFMPWLVLCRNRQPRFRIHRLFRPIFLILLLSLLLLCWSSDASPASPWLIQTSCFLFCPSWSFAGAASTVLGS